MKETNEKPPSLAVGQRLTLTIADLAFGGEGVARVEEFVVFVPFVLIGETVEVELTEVKKRFARARLIQIITPAAERVTPVCQYFGECGGCQYQHLDYSAQLRLKRKQIGDILQHLGGFPPTLVEPVVPCPQPYGYRNRIMIRSQWDKFKRRLNIGYIRADNRLVVDVEECPIAAPELNRQLREVRAHPPPKGGIKVVLRLPPEGWEMPPDAFFQNNFILLPQLVATVRACLQDSGARFLMDVYCGVGFFSLELADQVEAFLGIEYDRRAVQAARRNALLRQRPNGEYLEGKTEAVLPLVMARFPRSNTAIILDPPRTGCPPVCLQTLRSAAPAQVIYVSCHPATLARDLKLLCAEGLFELVRLTPLDMFPQTQHIECVADLRCRRKPEAEASPPIDKIPLPRTQ